MPFALEAKRPLADAAVLIIWPKASASVGVVLESFLRRHRRTSSAVFVFVAHPVPGAVLRESEVQVYVGPDEARHTRIGRERYLPLVSDALDAIISVPFLLATCRRYDLLVTAGLNLALLGIFLRWIGLVRCVAFVVMDYWPRKYNSPVWSDIYRRVYGWCSTHVDSVVDVAPTIEAARVLDGIRVHPSKRMTIPHVIDPAAVGSLPRDHLELDSLVWTGAVTPQCGFDLVLEAVELIAPQRPGITIHITSYTPFPNHLWRVIQKKGLERHFRFLGYIRDELEFSRTVRRFRVGLAPYSPRGDTVKRFAGVARPWTYIANGVPPVMTRVPYDAEEIERSGAGIIIDYQPDQLAEAILRLLTDEDLHEACRQRGLALVRSRAPQPVFAAMLTRLGLVPDVETRQPSSVRA